MPISDYLRGLRDKVGHERILAPSVTGIVINDKGEVLLQRVSENGSGQPRDSDEAIEYFSELKLWI